MINYFKKFSIMFLVLLTVIGIGVVQNEAVVNAATTSWNLNDKYTTDTVTFANGDLTLKTSDARNSYATVRATQGKSSGKWYFETRLDNGAFQVGIQSNKINLLQDPLPDRVNDSVGYYNYVNKINYKRYDVTTDHISQGDFIGVAVDMDNKKISFYKNGNPMVEAINISFNQLEINSDTLYPVVSVIDPGSQITTNFGAKPFEYKVPDGYVAFDESDVSISSITLNKSTDNLKVGQTDNLVATTTPSDTEVIWSSSDKTIATVDKNGKVAGIKEGQAIITATIKGTDIKATCEVTVSKDGGSNPNNQNGNESIGDGSLYIEMVDGNIKRADKNQLNKFKSWFIGRDLDKTENPIFEIVNAKGNVEYLVHDKIVGFQVR